MYLKENDMKKRLLAIVLIVALVFGSGGNVSAQAAQSDANMVLEDSLYVGQSRRIIFQYGTSVVKGSKVDFEIIKGSDVVEMPDEKTIKALSAGEALIRGTYKKYSIDYVITVVEAPKMKARKVKVGGVKIAVPKDFVDGEPSEGGILLKNTKNDTSLIIGAGMSYDIENTKLSQDDWDQINNEIAAAVETTCNAVFSSYMGAGFELTDMDYTSETVKNGTVRYQCAFKLKNIGNYYLDVVGICKEDGTVILAIAAGYSKKTVNGSIDYILKKN